MPKPVLKAVCLQVIVPQKVFILRSKFSFFPSDAVSLTNSTPILDAAGRILLFKVHKQLSALPHDTAHDVVLPQAGQHEYALRASSDEDAADWLQQLRASCSQT